MSHQRLHRLRTFSRKLAGELQDGLQLTLDPSKVDRVLRTDPAGWVVTHFGESGSFITLSAIDVEVTRYRTQRGMSYSVPQYASFLLEVDVETEAPVLFDLNMEEKDFSKSYAFSNYLIRKYRVTSHPCTREEVERWEVDYGKCLDQTDEEQSTEVEFLRNEYSVNGKG